MEIKWHYKLMAWKNKQNTQIFINKSSTHFPKLAPLLRLLKSSSSELESDSESGGSVRRSRWPDPFLVFFLLLSPSPISAFSSFLFFIFFWGVSEPAELDLNPTKSSVLSSLVDEVCYVAAKLTRRYIASLNFNHATSLKDVNTLDFPGLLPCWLTLKTQKCSPSDQHYVAITEERL